jgi:hypothetical protein
MRASSTSNSGRRCYRKVFVCPQRATARSASRRGAQAATSPACACRPELEDLRPAGSDQAFSRIAGDIRVQRDATTDSIEATGLELSRPGAAWRPTTLEARRHAEGRPHFAALAARADYSGSRTSRHSPAACRPGTLRERIKSLAPRGELFGPRPGGHGRRRQETAGRHRPAAFLEPRIQPSGQSAGITGFDGAVEGRGGGGIVELATRDATIDWPQQWRAPARLLRGDGRVRMASIRHRSADLVDDAMADSGHGIARGKLRMLLRPGELPLMGHQCNRVGF